VSERGRQQGGSCRFLAPCVSLTRSRRRPPHCHLPPACSGHIHVAVTRLTPGLQPTLVSQFEDREDLIQALLTSCHIPWYFDGSLVRRYRASAAFDGGE
jgi:hypothetical protein